MNKKIARCLHCYKDFTEIEIKGRDCCPFCGCKGIPCSPKEDIKIKINWHELRILIIWAENWARQIKNKTNDIDSSLTVACIARRLQKQFPNKTPLTLAGELTQLREKMPNFEIKETNIDENPNKIAGEFDS